MKAFLFSYSALAQPEYVHNVLNTTRAIATWVTPFPYSAIVVSDLTVNELTAVFQTHMGEAWFIIVELAAGSCNGILPKQFWEYVENPLNAWTKKIMAQFEASKPPAILSPPPMIELPPSSYKNKP